MSDLIIALIGHDLVTGAVVTVIGAIGTYFDIRRDRRSSDVSKRRP